MLEPGLGSIREKTEGGSERKADNPPLNPSNLGNGSNPVFPYSNDNTVSYNRKISEEQTGNPSLTASDSKFPPNDVADPPPAGTSTPFDQKSNSGYASYTYKSSGAPASLSKVSSSSGNPSGEKPPMLSSATPTFGANSGGNSASVPPAYYKKSANTDGAGKDLAGQTGGGSGSQSNVETENKQGQPPSPGLYKIASGQPLTPGVLAPTPDVAPDILEEHNRKNGDKKDESHRRVAEVGIPGDSSVLFRDSSYLVYSKGGSSSSNKDKYSLVDCFQSETPRWYIDLDLKKIEGKIENPKIQENLSGRKLLFLNYGDALLTKPSCNLDGFLADFGGTLENYASRQVVPVGEDGKFMATFSQVHSKDQVAILILDKDQDEDSVSFGPHQFLGVFEVKQKIPPPIGKRPRPDKE